MPFVSPMIYYSNFDEPDAGSFLYRPAGGLLFVGTTTTFSADSIELVDFTTPSDGSVTTDAVFCSVHANLVGKKARPAIYTLAGSLMATGAEVTIGSDPIQKFPLAGSLQLASSTTYLCGLHLETAANMNVATTGSQYRALSQTYASGTPSSVTLSGPLTNPINAWVPLKYAATPAGTDFISDNGNARSGSILMLALPDDYAVGDIVFLHVYGAFSANGASAVFVTPSGWTSISNDYLGGNSNTRHLLFARRIDGTESPVLYITQTGGTSAFILADISVWRGMVASGSFYEGAADNSGTSTAPTGTGITTTGDDRLLIDFVSEADDTAFTPGGSYAVDYETFTTIGNDGRVIGASKDAPTAGSYSAQAHSLAASELWRVTSLALIRDSA